MRYQDHDTDCQDLCASRTSCAGASSSRRTALGPDGFCSSCAAHKALNALEVLCADEGTALDVAYEALRAREDDLAAVIERLWEAEELPEERGVCGRCDHKRCVCEPTIDDLVMGVATK